MIYKYIIFGVCAIGSVYSGFRLSGFAGVFLLDAVAVTVHAMVAIVAVRLMFEE